MNRPFLPLLQMSESETLISMVNRMVESSSPRAQIFMQVRPPPGSMVPISTISAACAWSSQAIWAGVCSALPTHPPGLISWAPPRPAPLIPLCLLHSSCSWVNPRPISQTINITSTDSHTMPAIANLLSQVQDFCFMLGIFFTNIFGVQGTRGVTWNHLMPHWCRICCGHRMYH